MKQLFLLLSFMLTQWAMGQKTSLIKNGYAFSKTVSPGTAPAEGIQGAGPTKDYLAYLDLAQSVKAFIANAWINGSYYTVNATSIKEGKVILRKSGTREKITIKASGKNELLFLQFEASEEGKKLPAPYKKRTGSILLELKVNNKTIYHLIPKIIDLGVDLSVS